jgi:xanthosine utilization system XapX-like protein
MRVYRYSLRSLAGDYIRSGAGLAVGVGVLLSVPPSPAIIGIFGSVVMLFGLFLLRTAQRQLLKVAVTDEEICNASIWSRAMSWNDLERFKLRYFGTKRDNRSSGGFMQLTLKGGGRSFTFESSLEGFDYIAWRASKAARENGLSMDPTSAGNLLAIGLDADGEMPPPG